MSVSPLSRSLRKSLLPVNPFVFSYPLGRGGWASTPFLFLLVFHWVINWKGVSMRKLIKRIVAVASAVVICGVSCVTSWFSVPVSAIGVFSPFNFYQLYQMLHGLLLGDGGGNSQTFGEWLEKNMTRTVGSGNSKQEFLITPDMKLSDMMDEASMRLMLGAACSDGGFAGVSKMKDLIDSWTEVYTSSDIGEIGESGGSSGFIPGALSSDGKIFRLSASASYSTPQLLWSGNIRFSDGTSDNVTSTVNLVSYPIGTDDCYMLCKNDVIYLVTLYDKVTKYGFRLDGRYNVSLSSGNGYRNFTVDGVRYQYDLYDYSLYLNGIPTIRYMLEQAGISLVDIGDSSIQSFFSNIGDVSFSDLGVSDDFIGPVYAMPAAKQLITDTGTLSGLRLDVQTEDGTPDISAALDHAGVESVDDLVSGVAAGTIPMSQVYEDMRVVPYVLTDVETGQVVTDLNVSATDAKTKAVALDKTLSIPKDVSAAEAYQVTGKTWDPSLSKYKLPLFNFFPFCLPWDIYQVLSAFATDPVAPSFTIPVGKFFSGKKSFDGSAAADITATIDLGDDKFSKWFVMLRALESAGIVIGLVLVSVKLIHGGR